MTGGRRGALLLVASLVTPGHAWAQAVECAPIRSGETAARVAKRITGAAANQQEPWFQILDPAANRFVAKSQYQRLQPDWKACIVGAPLTHEAARGPLGWSAATLESPLVLWSLLALAIAMIASGLHDYVRARAATLKQFGERFAREFDRPLVRSRPFEPVVEARLRVRPHRARVEVLLAPRGGRPYPNLIDHKQNVEYDVERVLRVLEDRRFVHGPLYAQGRWVVVPLQFQVNPQQAGGK